MVVVGLPVTLAAFVATVLYWGIGQHHGQFDLRLYYDAVNWWQSGHDLFSYSQPDPVNIRLGFTYPPLAAILMSPMGLLSYPVVLVTSLIAIVASGAVFVYLVLRERIRLPKPLMFGLVGVCTAAAFTLEPFRQTFSFGQINIYLGLLVALDLLVLGRRGSRWTGVGIGLAAAIKLTPGIFILYLLVVGRWRAAVTAMSAAVGFTLASALIAPTETWRYFTSLMWETSRVGFLDTTMNQSVNGLLARLASPLPPGHKEWLLLAGVLAVAGFWRARRAALAGDELAGMTLAGLVGVLVSPVSWVHHIVWVFPAMVILTQRLAGAVSALMRDDGGSESTLAARIVQVVSYSVLMTTGLAIWCTPTAALMNVRDSDYVDGGSVLAFAGSVQLLWMIVVLCVLPVDRVLAGRAGGPADGGAVPAVIAARDGSARGNHGSTLGRDESVPAAARRNRIVMSTSGMPTALGEQRSIAGDPPPRH
jgi:alpha-1,2-mannosyltransferase